MGLKCGVNYALPPPRRAVLSARLGTGKGGLRLAPEELLLEVLQVGGGGAGAGEVGRAGDGGEGGAGGKQ